ncbi:MAG TPA: Ig-like domain-containing protein, partial [Hyphomicrobiales bacterium]|nr:Ig-like domain-containing protein [Hyphomicrobiales bacterium]
MKSTGSFGWVYTIGAALTALIALLYFGGALDGLKPTPPVPAGLTSNGDTAGGAPAKPAEETAKPAGDTAAPAADKPAEEARTEPAADTAAAPADAAKAAAPSFDVVRVEPDGSTVVAGQAAPGSTVRLMAGDMVVGEAVADASGSFAIVLDKPLGAG